MRWNKENQKGILKSLDFLCQENQEAGFIFFPIVLDRYCNTNYQRKSFIDFVSNYFEQQGYRVVLSNDEKFLDIYYD